MKERVKIIDTILPGLPPTQNHAYATAYKKAGGKLIATRRLSEEARGFKLMVRTTISRECAGELAEITSNDMYELHITLRFPEEKLVNRTYPKKTSTRYKKVDALNRAKILEDALADAFGIDDSHNFVVRIEKTVGAGDTRVALYKML